MSLWKRLLEGIFSVVQFSFKRVLCPVHVSMRHFCIRFGRPGEPSSPSRHHRRAATHPPTYPCTIIDISGRRRRLCGAMTKRPDPRRGTHQMPSLFPPFRLTGPSPRHPPFGRSGTPSPPHFPSFLLLPPAVHETAMLLKSPPKRRRIWPCARGRPRGRGDRTRGHTVPGTRPNRSLGSKLSPD